MCYRSWKLQRASYRETAVSRKFSRRTMGPYVSQFLPQPAMLAAQPSNRPTIGYQPGKNYRTGSRQPPNEEAGPYYVHDGSGLGALAKLGRALYNEYPAAAGASETTRPTPLEGRRCKTVSARSAGPTNGAALGEVAAKALNAVWHRKCRPHAPARRDRHDRLASFLDENGDFAPQIQRRDFPQRLRYPPEGVSQETLRGAQDRAICWKTRSLCALPARRASRSNTGLPPRPATPRRAKPPEA